MPFRHADGTHALFDLGQVKLRVRRVSVLRRPTIRPMADAGTVQRPPKPLSHRINIHGVSCAGLRRKRNADA
ncbi:hypothetical protein K0M31_020368, partial [Melipona bicolor]